MVMGEGGGIVVLAALDLAARSSWRSSRVSA